MRHEQQLERPSDRCLAYQVVKPERERCSQTLYGRHRRKHFVSGSPPFGKLAS